MGEAVSVDRVAERTIIRDKLNLIINAMMRPTEERISALQVLALVNLAETFDSYLKLQEMESRVRKLEEQLRG